MNPGSRDERKMLLDIDRCANALERIANAVEQQVYGITGQELREIKAQVAHDMRDHARAEARSS